ncbi:MAG: FAD-binding protein [Janthinobacterium lividum]
MADFAPDTEDGIAEVVREARARGEPLLVRGRGSKMGMLRPVQAAGSLSTRNHAGIGLYAPNELILSAKAGTALAEVEAALASGGQHLIAEPPDLGALLSPGGEAVAQSIGGVVATNLSGPRRVAWGAMRDHVMGVRVVNGAGEVTRSGGRVLKNVTGLDLCKLLTGSHGTLGVITEVTVKVLPRPERTGSVVLAGLDARAGVAALSAGLGSPYAVSGAAWLPAEAAARVEGLPAGPLAILRIEDVAHSTEYRLGRLVGEMAAFAQPVRLEHEASLAAWAAIRDARPLRAEAGDAVWRVSVRPSRGPGVLDAAEAAGVRGFLDWGGGLAWLAGPASEAAHGAVSRAALAAGGVWTLLRAPDGLRAAVDVVPPEAAALAAITRRVKAAMDPGGVLNPGRMVAGL